MQIKIGNRIYQVFFDDRERLLENAPMQTFGCIDYAGSKIFISPNISSDYEKEILLHEVLHGIIDDAHINEIVKNEKAIESFVSALAPRLIQVLCDNSELVSFLVSSNKFPIKS